MSNYSQGYRNAFLSTLFVLALPIAASARSYVGGEPTRGKYRNTYYLVAEEKDYSEGPKTAALKDMDENVLAMVTPLFKKKIDLEGTGILLDGRVLNFAGRKADGIRFAFTIHRFGRGVGDCELVPFHTVAVDPKRIKLGSLVKIAETVGMELPDGTKHDGLWRAEDVGGAIQADRIDLFVGLEPWAPLLQKAGITHLKALTVTLVAPPPAESCVVQTPQ